MRLLLLFSCFALLLCCLACGTETTTNDDTTVDPGTTTTNENEISSNTTAAPIALYAWVNRLNLRAQPEATAEIIAKLETHQTLLPTGNQSPQTEPVVLRGVLYEAPWIEVQIPDGRTGWVYGGAVRTKQESKGNPPITAMRFSFPAFGGFDLNEWEKVSETPSDTEGDFDRLTVRYRQTDQQLEIESYEGEYGYGYHYRLQDATGGLLMERHFRYDNFSLEITEEVVDHLGLEPKYFSRSQAVPLPYQQLNDRPMLLTGDWEEG